LFIFNFLVADTQTFCDGPWLPD